MHSISNFFYPMNVVIVFYFFFTFAALLILLLPSNILCLSHRPLYQIVYVSSIELYTHIHTQCSYIKLYDIKESTLVLRLHFCYYKIEMGEQRRGSRRHMHTIATTLQPLTLILSFQELQNCNIMCRHKISNSHIYTP